MSRVTTKKLAGEVSSMIDVPVDTVIDVMNTAFGQMTKCLEEGHPVSIRNFGVFELKQTASRDIYNVHSEKLEKVESRSKPRFRPSATLIKQVNQN